MSRFKELGYTDKDFGPNRTFLTERAAETALASGIAQLRAVRPEIELIRDFINEHTTNSQYQFPGDIDDLSFAFRWGGKGNKLMWKMPLFGERGWDTMLHNADPHTRFLNGWNISQQNVDQLRLGSIPLASETLNEMNPFTTVEITVADWERPRLTQQFVSGVLFNRAQRRGRTTSENFWQDVHEAFDSEATSRFELVKMAADIGGRPFDDIMPIAALPRE